MDQILRRTTTVCLASLLFVQVTVAEGLKVGVYKDGRTYSDKTIKPLLEKNGMRVTVLTRKQLNAEAVADLDVMCFLDGWNSYKYLRFEGRKLMADFVAHGKGVFAGAFRSGIVRTANRPMFPEVAYSWNRVNGNFVFPERSREDPQ